MSRALVKPQAAFFRDIQYDVGPCQRRLGVAARHFVHRLKQKVIRDGGHVFGSERLGQRCFELRGGAGRIADVPGDHGEKGLGAYPSVRPELAADGGVPARTINT